MRTAKSLSLGTMQSPLLAGDARMAHAALLSLQPPRAYQYSLSSGRTVHPSCPIPRGKICQGLAEKEPGQWKRNQQPQSRAPICVLHQFSPFPPSVTAKWVQASQPALRRRIHKPCGYVQVSSSSVPSLQPA